MLHLRLILRVDVRPNLSETKRRLGVHATLDLRNLKPQSYDKKAQNLADLGRPIQHSTRAVGEVADLATSSSLKTTCFGFEEHPGGHAASLDTILYLA